MEVSNVSCTLQDQRLEDNEVLRIPPAYPHPPGLVAQCSDKATSHSPPPARHTASSASPRVLSTNCVRSRHPWSPPWVIYHHWYVPSLRRIPVYGDPPGCMCTPVDIRPLPSSPPCMSHYHLTIPLDISSLQIAAQNRVKKKLTLNFVFHLS